MGGVRGLYSARGFRGVLCAVVYIKSAGAFAMSGRPGGRQNAQNRAPRQNAQNSALRVEPRTFGGELANFYKFRALETDLEGAHEFLGDIFFGEPNIENTWKIHLQFGCGLVAKIPFLRASPFEYDCVWVCMDSLTPAKAALWQAFSVYVRYPTSDAPIENITVVLRNPMTVRVQQDDDENVYMDFQQDRELAHGSGLDAEALVEQADAVLALLG